MKRRNKAEIKAFTVSNRNANGLSKKVGFNAVTPKGVAWIPYSVASEYITLNERISLNKVYQMISDNDIQVIAFEDFLRSLQAQNESLTE